MSAEVDSPDHTSALNERPHKRIRCDISAHWTLLLTHRVEQIFKMWINGSSEDVAKGASLTYVFKVLLRRSYAITV